MTDRSRQRSNPDSRVPPHNLEAEGSVLGACLLQRSAVEALVAGARAEDFYRPAHQHVAHAIHRMHEEDLAVDVVTVGEYLRRTGTLELVGGLEFLNGLTDVTPAVSRAAAYARIVHDTAVLRRLLSTAAAISEIAYGGPTDTGRAVADAQDLLAAMGAQTDLRFSTLEIADLGALLATDLEAEEPILLTRTDGKGLFYAGKMHMLQAEPSSGKSWIALFACLEVLLAGGSFVYIDFEDTARGIVKRLLQLGASSADIAARGSYIQPIGKFGAAERANLAREMDRLNPDLVIIDGVAESLSRDGLSEDKADDFVKWVEKLPRWIARTGAAVVMLDHVSKDPEGRGRWARGTGAKLGAMDGTSYQVKVVRSFSRNRDGVVKLVVAKDRPGGVGAIGDVAAVMTVEPKGGGERVMVRFDPPAEETGAPTDAFKPTHTMERVMETIAGASVSMNASTITNLRLGDAKIVRQAIARLIAEGFLREKPGRGRHLEIIRPYHGQTNREPPPPDPVEEALFDRDPYEVAEEPEWIDAERRAHADHITREDYHR